MERCVAITAAGERCKRMASGKYGDVCGTHAPRTTENGRPICRAKSKSTGVPCQNPPIPGGTVCRIHGGKAPQTAAKAARRVLEELTGPAMAFLAALVRDEKATNSDRFKAAKDILDRNGFKPPLEIDGRLTLDMIEREISFYEALQAE